MSISLFVFYQNSAKLCAPVGNSCEVIKIILHPEYLHYLRSVRANEFAFRITFIRFQ